MVGKLFKGLGGKVKDFVRSLKGAQMQARKVMKKDPLPDISDDVHKMRAVGGKKAEEINKKIDVAYEKLNKEVSGKAKELRLQNDKLEVQQRAMNRHQNSFSTAKSNHVYTENRYKVLSDQLERKRAKMGVDFDDADPLVAKVDLAEAQMYDAKRVMDNAENSYQSAAMTFQARHRKVQDLSDELEELRKLSHMAERSPEELINRMDIPGMGYDQPLVQEFIREIAGPVAEKNAIYKALSRNINNDRRFVKEYLKEIHGKDNPYATAWRSNPTNVAKLTELEYSKKYTKYLSNIGDEAAAKAAVKSMSRMDLAKTVGGTALMAAPIALMSSASESAEEVAQVSGNVLSTLNSFESQGLGEVIRKKALNAVIETNNIYDEFEKEMINDPEKTLTALSENLTKQQAILNNSISRWSIVVRSANNEAAAQKALQELSGFNTKIAKNLKDMGTIVAKAEQTKPQGPSQAGTVKRLTPKARPSADLKSVQSYLSDYEPTVAPSGILDRPTVAALKELEQEFNRAHGSNRFTGMLVDTRTKKVMSVEEIKRTKKFLNIR